MSKGTVVKVPSEPHGPVAPHIKIQGFALPNALVHGSFAVESSILSSRWVGTEYGKC